jgi:hypothetical protein
MMTFLALVSDFFWYKRRETKCATPAAQSRHATPAKCEEAENESSE